MGDGTGINGWRRNRIAKKAGRTDVIHYLTRTLGPGQRLLGDWALMRQKVPVDTLFHTLYFLVLHL